MDEPKRPQQERRGRNYITDRGSLRRGFPFQRPTYGVAKTEHEKPKQPQQTTTPDTKVLDGVAQRKPSSAKRTISKAKPAMPRLHRSFVLKRHIVERANEHRKEIRRQHKRHFASSIVGGIIIAALAVVIWAFWDFLPGLKSISLPFISSSDQSKKPEPVITKPKSNLDENRPSGGDIEVYQAAADAPRILRIPILEIESRIKRVGSSLAGEPISPSNIYDVGWFDESAKPGQIGAMLINGHVSGPTKQGIFHGIGSLKPGDEIMIERGDRSVITYIVDKVQAYNGDQVDISTILQPIVADKNGLNLLTSTASYDGTVSKSEKRVIVFALQK